MKSVIQTAVEICSLPAVPTHNWANLAANTLTTLSTGITAGVLIAHLDETTSKIDLISAGVSETNTDNSSEPSANTLYLLDKLERLTTLGLTLPVNSCQRGLVAALTTLQSNWQSTPIGRIFASQGYQAPCISIIPITHDHPGFVLVCALTTGPTLQQPDPSKIGDDLITDMAHVVPILSMKAHTALAQVTNPKAWLTDREKVILDQLILGNSVRVIADTLNRSTHTVHDHVKNLHKKLNATSRGQLIAKALGHSTTQALHSTPAPNPMILVEHPPLPELKPENKKQVFPPQAKPMR